MIETEKRIKRQRELDCKAYEIAKQISEVAKTKWEVEEMLGKIEKQFSWALQRTEIKLADFPVDRYGNKIMPQE